MRALPGARGLPVLMLTARASRWTASSAWRLGADDYLPKPFEPRELLARIRACCAGAAPARRAPTRCCASAARDRPRRAPVTVDGEPCDLTSHQFDLLVVLAERAGRVLSRDQIMEALRGRQLEAFDRSIDVHMSRIRAAIEDDAKNPKRILTVRGVGLRVRQAAGLTTQLASPGLR